MDNHGQLVVGDATLIETVLLAVEKTLLNDGRMQVPSGLLKEMSFVIPLDIQIRLQSGHTVIINHEIKGEFSIVPDEEINGHPVLRGHVTAQG